MREVNWNNFRAKFNGKETKAFEYLCQLLFCCEFGRPTGIFRYKNQAGIETEPVFHNEQWIGFQSKFFENKINQQEIEKSIDTAKRKNPNLNKIYVYLNLEFSESSKKDGKEPKNKTAIESFAKARDVEIEWRVSSHFETQLAWPQNRSLAEYFFSLEKGALDALRELAEHSRTILRPIHSHIEFKGSEIKINRQASLTKLTAALKVSPLVILSGVAGVGKTALVKDFVASLGPNVSLFILKATEFNVSHINDLFKNYGNLSLLDFVNEHEDVELKYLVIDSAEKLADLETQEAFQEFMSTLLEHEWKIIFTTRYSYLDDLKFQFLEVYRLTFEPLLIENLTADELKSLSIRFDFPLPANARLLELLRNPFYLDEYLHAHDASSEDVTLSGFKTLLWEKHIAKTSHRHNNIHLKRETCFLNLSKTRADSGGFFVSEVVGSDAEALKALEADEIIERDSQTGRYFITHDIYEEWALEKLIDRTFNTSANHYESFHSLGSSLPIRRAFRNWLSESLLERRDQVRPLIEATFTSPEIDTYWKDEILIAVLLSDYADVFFQMFENILLADNQKLLMRVIFLLRIACKEIDESLLKLLGVGRENSDSLKTVFTRPRGAGWNCAIEFLHRHNADIADSHMSIILPLLEDWNNKNQGGATTRFSGLLALRYYEAADKSDQRGYRDLEQQKKRLVKIVLSASAELKEELKTIFDEIISAREVHYRSKHHELVRAVLGSVTESYIVAQHQPEQVIQLADIAWFEDPNDERDPEERHSRMLEVEARFCISTTRIDYFPASAFQTPTYQLLKYATQSTIDFILSFTNRTVECYARSGFRNELEQVEVFLGPNETVKQYLSPRLWNTYRGTQVSTHLLESMHMALERWLLEYGKTASPSDLDSLCKYLLKNAHSASITAVIASVCLAQPSKLFEVAKILFQTRQFFFYDTGRMMLDQRAAQFYTFGAGFDFENKIFEGERINTCEDLHRRESLEQLAFKYQLIKLERDDDDDSVRERQRALWAIFDDYYFKLPDPAAETEADKTWRLYLARMDRRKMSVEQKEADGQVLVQFNPQIDSELRKFSEDSLKRSSRATRHSSLYLWSQVRFRQETSQYGQYPTYEGDPQTVVAETKRIMNESPDSTNETWSRSFNASIPAYSCAVLMRDFADRLTDQDKEFCKEVLLGFASSPVELGTYYYQTGDGVEPAILTLPALLKCFPADHESIKSLLLTLLLYRSPTETSNFALRAILHSLWDISFADAQSLFVGHLLLKPAYERLSDEAREEHYRDFEFSEFSPELVWQRFRAEYQRAIADIVSNKIAYSAVNDVAKCELEVLNTAFQLLPLGTADQTHQQFVATIFPVFAKRVFADREDKIDYTLKRGFLEKFAYFVLKSPTDQIPGYLQPFIDNFHVSSDTAEFFSQFIWAEDRLVCYEEFWTVWNAFYGKIVELCQNGRARHSTQAVVHNYLLAWSNWNPKAREWHTLKDRERLFFQKVAREIGHEPAVFYSLLRFLNEIGASFFAEGIFWISDILQEERLHSEELEVNTEYYLENLVRKYILLKRNTVKSSIQVKRQILVILNFLVEKGSVVGYLLREDVL